MRAKQAMTRGSISRQGLWRYLCVERLFVGVCLLAALSPLVLLGASLGQLAHLGVERLSWEFLASPPSRHPSQGGLLPAALGSLYLLGLTALMSVPTGVGAAIYLAEYERPGRTSRWLELNIANLSGVPPVIYGLLGLGLFLRTLNFMPGVFAGAATLSLLVLPLVIVASRRSLENVPASHREACIALGATRWQTVRQVILPAALPGILTGCILALTRAIGEATPLLVLGAITFASFSPDGVTTPFTALPVQIFDWLLRPEPGFLTNAAAGILVLLATMLAFNLLAVLARKQAARS